MGNNLKQNELPEDKASLEIIKLQAEIREIQKNIAKSEEEVLAIKENIAKSQSGRSWKGSVKMLQLSLAILVGVSPLIIGMCNYRHEVRKYVETAEREQKFRVTKEVIQLFQDLSSEESKKERIAALAMAGYGLAASPFLVEHLNIDHKVKVYSAINRSLRYIVDEAESPAKGEDFIKSIGKDLIPATEKNVGLFMRGKLKEISRLEAQIHALGIIATKTKYSSDSKFGKQIVKDLKTFYSKIKKDKDIQDNQNTKSLLLIIELYIEKKNHN